MKPLVKLVCASCGTTVGRIGRNVDGSMVQERIEHNRHFHGGGSAPKGFPFEGSTAAHLIDRSEKVIHDPREGLRSWEKAGDTEMVDLLRNHSFFAYSAICWKCTAAISITQGKIMEALDAAEAKNKVRRGVLHPRPDP